MASSNIFLKNIDLLDDSEVEDTMSRNSNVSPNLNEKPLSPIISGSLNNRKFLIGRRLSHKRSRINLSNRFKETSEDSLTIVNPINISLPVSLDDSLSVSQTKGLIDHLDKLEELENSRNNIYKVLAGNKKDEFIVPKLPEKVKVCTNNERNVNVKSKFDIQESIPQEIIPNQLSVGFQTATGKSVSVSETDMKKYSKLFEDIIHPTQGEGRQNKHAFLTKIKHKDLENSLETDLNSVSVNSSCPKKLTQSNASIGANSNIKISDKSLLQAKQFFMDEEFGDIKFNSDSFCGFRKASVQTFCETDTSKETNTSKKVEVSLTQAICDSGISNTQIVNAFDDILNTLEEDANFRGFTDCDVKKSQDKLVSMEKALEHSHLECSKKRKMSISSTNEYYNCDIEGFKNVANIFPAKKKKRTCDELVDKVNENYSLATGNQSRGFMSASGKIITISDKYMKNAETIFRDMSEDFAQLKKPTLCNISERNECRKTNLSCETSRNSIAKPKNYNENFAVKPNSSKPVILPEKSIQRVKNIFSEEDFGDLMFNNNLCGFKKASVAHPTHIKSNNSNLKEVYIEKETLIESVPKYCTKSENDDYTKFSTAKSNFIQENNPTSGFCKASGRQVDISKSSFDKAKNVFDNLDVDYSYQNYDQTLAAQSLTTAVKVNHSDMHRSSKDTSVLKNFSVKDMSIKTTPVSLNKSKSFGLSANNSKKKLGMSHFKPIQIGNDKLKKAKLLFDDDYAGVSPLKPRQTTTYTSTPIKQYDNSTSKDHYIRPKNSFCSFMEAADITPIKMNIVENKELDVTSSSDIKIMFTSPTKSNWLDDLETERKKLELRLQILSERERLGQDAVCRLAMGKAGEDKMPRKGFLYRMKTANNRISLRDFVANKKPGVDIADIELRVNSKNAENVHFTEQLVSCVETKDGAFVIPNSRDIVGLSEIKTAFEAMPGVEPRLIPNGWIRNHYKWIVWKLACYENQFPNYFSECLNIENVVQQLKYRYDREIDKAERSALRKILEKDDAPQKRMVLCVSDIKMVAVRKYELELTDGWYAIRTIIDEPLCNQIVNGKIKIGTKLVISGAELLNCDGCHPLEATNIVCLKINCNSTRRAVWHAKLGFQRNSNPFPIQLQSVYPFGGPIAAVKVCVVRVYPFKYMEKLEGGSVWRNRRAEEIAAQKWENERFKKIERIQQEVSRKYENSYSYNESTDFHENLSVSQRESFQDYQSSLSVKKQAEMAEEVSASVSKMKLNKREVVAVLKLLVIDAIGSSDKPFNFFVWRPTEAHLQTLREGKSFIVQNVVPRPNGDLNSTMKTTFKPLESVHNCKCTKYKRRLVKISELFESKSLPEFNEFDTVGIVVQVTIETRKQEVWITDNSGRLLFVTVNEGPSTCSLLDNLKRGQSTTVCNLIYNGLKKDIVQATANHFTVFSSYSQHKHLQDGLEQFKKRIVTDVPSLLNDCDSKIEVFRIISDINSFSANFEMTDETLVTLDRC